MNEEQVDTLVDATQVCQLFRRLVDDMNSGLTKQRHPDWNAIEYWKSESSEIEKKLDAMISRGATP